MPYSDISSQHDDINSAHHDSSQLPVYNNHSDPIDNQAQTFPKSILRNSGSSDSGQGHGRSVKFRNTPDFAYPERFAQEREDTEDEVPEVGLCDPPRWTLRKPAQGKGQQQRQHQVQNRLSDGEADLVSPARPTNSQLDTQSRITVDQRTNNQDEQGHDPQSLSTNALRETSRVSTIPLLLANAHQQLLAGHGVAPSVSGKRSGRALIQNLESMAEVQLDAGVDGNAYSKRIQDEEDVRNEQVSWCVCDSHELISSLDQGNSPVINHNPHRMNTLRSPTCHFIRYHPQMDDCLPLSPTGEMTKAITRNNLMTDK
jgi:hypothetical protein